MIEENSYDSRFCRLLAKAAHSGQIDKAGKDYYDHHVIKVVERVKARPDCTSIEMQLAYLHDVVEDTNVTIEDIEDVFGLMLSSPLSILTRFKKDSSYWEYIEKIKHGPKCCKVVKIADLEDHLERKENISESHVIRYKDALKFLAE